MEDQKKKILDELLVATRQIEGRALRGSGNYIVVNTRISSILNNLWSPLTNKRIEKLKGLLNNIS